MRKDLLKLGTNSVISASTPGRLEYFIEIPNKTKRSYQKMSNNQKKKIDLFRKKMVFIFLLN